MTSIRSKMILALIVPLAVLIPVAAVTLAATNSSRRTSDAVAHSTDVLEGAEKLLLAAVDSETGIRGFLITGDDRFLEPWNTGRASFDAEVARLRRELADNPEQLARLEKMASVEQQWRTQVGEAQIAARRAATPEAATIERAGTGKILKDQVRSAGADLLTAERSVLNSRIAANDRAVNRARIATIAGLALVTLILLSYALVLARTMQRDAERREALQSAVEQCSAFSSRVAAGDLTARLSPNGDGDLNRLYDNLNGMVSDLGAISRSLRSRAAEIGQATTGVLAAVSQHASTANQQSAAITQIATTVSQVRTTAEQTAGKAAEVATLAQGSARTGDDGLVAVRSIVDGMGQIRTTLDRLAGSILDLSEQAAQIDEIIATVSDFADQSNLLALNASIEAAKAGDQGRGFAVVAAEVRNLADQSKEATAAVRTILGEIRRATNAVVLATELGSRSAEERSGQATQAGEIIGQLKDAVHRAAQAAQVIAVSAHEQSVGMDQIAAAISEIRDASTSYAEGSAALQRSASDLDGVAVALRDLTTRYQVEV